MTQLYPSTIAVSRTSFNQSLVSTGSVDGGCTTPFRNFVRLRLTGSAAPMMALPPLLVIVSAIQRPTVVLPVLPRPIRKMHLRRPDRSMACGIVVGADCTRPSGGSDRTPTGAVDRTRGLSGIA